MTQDTSKDKHYLSLVIEPLCVCGNHRPGLGRRGKGVSLEEFRELYGADPFYSWLGLDSPLMYAAHRASSGMTSVYRQIGTGCQAVFRQMLRDHLGLTEDEANWSYQVPKGRGMRTLSLTGRINVQDVRDATARKRVADWLDAAKTRAAVGPRLAPQLEGAVFEVRQGYKSKDSKRQNADIANAVNAYQNLYLPVLILLSRQIDEDVSERYQAEKWLMLEGTIPGDKTSSTYAFCREVIGYDLAAFLQRNSDTIKNEVHRVLRTLLST